MSDEPFDRLASYVSTMGDAGRWLVLTHDNPDPDALASAMIVTRVLRTVLHRRVTTGYGGMIGRAENLAMVKLLHLKLSHVRNLSWSRYRHFALVDTQSNTGNNQLPPEIVPDLVIDHHPRRRGSNNRPLWDIRPEYGASATIAAEYLLASGRRPTAAEATAVVYALRTETQDFGREAAGPDERIHDLVSPLVNRRILARIQHPRLPQSYFAQLAQALQRVEAVDTLVLCHLDELAQPDMVPEIADLLLRLEGKTWSLCTGRHADRIVLSVRTTNPRANAGGLMQRLVGRRGRGGGHGMSAGGWVAAGPEPERLQQRLGERFVTLLKKNPRRITPLELDPGFSPGRVPPD